MIVDKTPLAVFVYNRLEHTKRMLASLEICHRLDECQVYIFSDGPKSIKEQQAAESVREIVHTWGQQHSVQIVESAVNLGLAKSIVGGVTRLCNEYGRVIVVEDDLVLHPQFLNYMLQALERYETDDRVAQISGYMFPARHEKKTDAFFLPFITTWGWATWSRAWRLFDWHPDITALEQSKLSRRFDLNNTYPFASMLKDQLAGRVQSWGILFYWAVFSESKLVLHPRLSLVRNEGFDGSGAHFRSSEKRYHLQPQFQAGWPELDEGFIWPESTRVDNRALRKHQRYLLSQLGLRTWIKKWLLK